VSLKRPEGVTKGPEVVETTHYASCGKASPLHVPARRQSGKAGILKCKFEAILPQAALMMEAAEQAIAAASAAAEAPVVAPVAANSTAANGTVSVASLKARAPAVPLDPQALLPDINLVVVAKPAAAGFSASQGAIYPIPEGRSPPYKAPFDIPNLACLTVKQTLLGPLAKYLVGDISKALAPRTICGPGIDVTVDAKLAGFDASACGPSTLTTGPVRKDLGTAALGALSVNVVGCNRTYIGKPDVTIIKLEPVHLYNTTWSVDTMVSPLVDKATNITAASLDTRTLQLPVNGKAAANFTLKVLKNAPIDLGNHLQGEVLITSGSLVPDVLTAARLAISTLLTSGNETTLNVTYVDLKCPSQVILPSAGGIGGLKCTFNTPWNTSVAGAVQAQIKTVTAKLFDVHSGTPKPFDFAGAAPVDLGSCVDVDRRYVGESGINEKPVTTLIDGVDAFLGLVRANLTRIGLPKARLAEMLRRDAGALRRLLADPEADAAKLEEPESAVVSTAGLKYIHPLKVFNGEAPPTPSSNSPLQLCKSATLTWTEQFGIAPVATCGEVYNALSTVVVTPNGTLMGAQPALTVNVSLPVRVSGCEAKPGVKLLAARAGAVRGYAWTVSAKAQDRLLATAQTANRPIVARYSVTYNRTTTIGAYTVEPAVALTNPFTTPMPIESVLATVSIHGKPAIVKSMRCKGAGVSEGSGYGSVLLPAAPLGAAPAPVGCVASIPLEGPQAGNVSITAVFKDGNITLAPTPFDARTAVDITTSDKLKCVTVDGGFVANAGANAKALLPTMTSGSAPRPHQLLCEPRKFAFNATFGPYTEQKDVCGSFVVSRCSGSFVLGGGVLAC